MRDDKKKLNDIECILVKDEGILETYINPVSGEEFTVLGECALNKDSKKVKSFKGVIYWSNNIPLLKQVATLKKICPIVKSKSNNELLEIIKGTSEWQFGIFLGDEAEEILIKAKQNELNILMMELE